MFLVNVKKCLEIFDRVYVSSDSPKMLKLAQKEGAIPILRGEKLCGDCPDIDVYKHALDNMTDVEGIVAVHANNPTVEARLIVAVKGLLEFGFKEIMTCYPVQNGNNYKEQSAKIYGSIRGLTKDRILNFGDPYLPKPDIMLVDDSIEIEYETDYQVALKQ